MASKWIEEGLVELGIKESPPPVEFDLEAIKEMTRVMDDANIPLARRGVFSSKLWSEETMRVYKDSLTTIKKIKR